MSKCVTVKDTYLHKPRIKSLDLPYAVSELETCHDSILKLAVHISTPAHALCSSLDIARVIKLDLMLNAIQLLVICILFPLLYKQKNSVLELLSSQCWLPIQRMRLLGRVLILFPYLD